MYVITFSKNYSFTYTILNLLSLKIKYVDNFDNEIQLSEYFCFLSRRRGKLHPEKRDQEMHHVVSRRGQGKYEEA